METAQRPEPCCVHDHHPVAHAIAWTLPALALGLVLWDASPSLRELFTGPPAPFCTPGPGSRAFTSHEGTRTRHLVLCADGTYGVIAREHLFSAILERGTWAPTPSGWITTRVRREGQLSPPRTVELLWPEEIGMDQFEAEWRNPQRFVFHPEMNERRVGRRTPVLDLADREPPRPARRQ